MEMNVVPSTSVSVRNGKLDAPARSSHAPIEEDSEYPALLGNSAQCQESRLINGVWCITQEEKDARTFILEYDISKVGINSWSLS